MVVLSKNDHIPLRDSVDSSVIPPNVAPSWRHETILRLDGLILAFGAFRFIGGPLQAVLPVAVQAVALFVNVLDRFQAELQGGGLQST